MIVIRVELWPATGGPKQELARMVIDNIGGSNRLGDYRCRTLIGRSKEALDRSLLQISGAGTKREGKVLGHPRLREHVWHLVAKALASVGYGRTGTPAKVASAAQLIALLDDPKIAASVNGQGGGRHA